MASNVPKFTSFRPKQKESPDPGKDLPKPEKRARSEKPTGRKHREKSTARPEAQRQPDPPREQSPSKWFFVDRRGDPDMVRYGRHSRYNGPSYRRIGYGYILGLPLDRKIDRDLSTDNEIVLTPVKKRREERLLTDKRAARERTRTIRFVQKPKEDGEDLNRDFVALSTTGKRKREEDGHNDEDGHDFDYRGIRDADSGKPADPDAEYESEVLVDSVDAEVTERNAALVRRTKDYPEDLQAWLDLVGHQEAVMKIGRPSTELRSSDKHHLADIRISIYEQALRKIGNDESKLIPLYCGMMTDAGRAWSERQLANKWTEILTKYPSNTNLWLKYVDFVQSTFATFKFEAVKDTFHKCLAALQPGSTSTDPGFFLYILVRLTSMMKEAGYQELALAIWQALLEYHMLAPTDTHLSGGEMLKMFEEFWESEMPRIGENDAKGWRNSNMDDAPSQFSGPYPLGEPQPSNGFLADFRDREIDHINKLKYPGRTTDEIGDDDPFHTVLFSDIEECVKLFPGTCPKPLMISAFLRFCHLPPIMWNDADDANYVFDSFLQAEFVGTPRDGVGGTRFSQLVSTYRSCPIKRFQMTPELLFDQGFSELSSIEVTFVRRALKLLAVDVSIGESIGEYLLALESRYFPTEAHKTAKQLLKTRPTSLRLYNAYGLVESRRNNSAQADRVFSAALSLQKGDSLFSTPGSLQLFYSWVWEALRQDNMKEARWRLVSLTGKIEKGSTESDEVPNQAALLRARRALSETCERALLSSEFFSAVMSTSLTGLLAYLSGGEKPESVLTASAQLSTWFTSHNMMRSSAAELHAQYIAQFLTYHAGHAPMVKPSLLRESLEPLIASFPNNTVLLSAYAANEARFSIDDRVRSIMHQRILSNDKDRSIVGWTFAIHYETLRSEVTGSTTHSIRALFQKAEDDVGAHCPALWKQHVLFEIEQARKERAKRPAKRPRKDGRKRKEEARVDEAYERVKETFFKGLTRLPWCKEYMMMAFTQLGEEFLEGEDLRKVYRVMGEKELRVYVEMGDGDRDGGV